MRFPHRLARHLAAVVLVVWLVAQLPASEYRTANTSGALRVEWFFDEEPGIGRCRWPTHLYRDAEWEIITDLKGCRLVYRRRAEGETWRASPLKLNQSHFVARFPGGTFVVADTDNHRLLTFTTPESAAAQVRTTVAGFPMLRPHDTVLNPNDGYIYIIDSYRRLYRVTESGDREEAWPFSEDVIGYARALSFFDGAIHIINSSDGEVLRIDDFEQRRYTRFRSPGKKERAAAGAFDRTGLVLNDVEKWGDWYYGTNYFCPSYAGGADPGVLRIIRWHTWDDFSTGAWQDVSDIAPGPCVPYFLCLSDGDLFVAVFDHESASGRDDRVLRVTLAP